MLTIRTGPHGTFDLPRGSWVLETSGDVTLPTDALDLDTSTFVVWADRMLRFTIEAVDTHGHPVAGALASVWRDGAATARPTRTDASGRAQVAVDGGARRAQLAVFEPRYEPALLDLESCANRPPTAPLRVTLANCTTSWVLEVVDAAGQPLADATIDARSQRPHAPTLRLGTTDAGGRVQVRGDWVLHGHFFLLAGSAFPFRAEPPEEVASGLYRMTAPRRVEGRIVLERPGERLDWTIAEPAQASLGTGVMPAFFSSPSGNEVVATSLPASWPARILARHNGTTVYDEVSTVDSDGWSIVAAIRRPPTRRLSLRSVTAAIARIEVPGSDHAVVYPLDPGAEPAHEVRIDVASDTRVSLQVHFDNGTSTFLIARPGREDAALVLAPPSFIEFELLAVDRRGAPICDARLSLSPVAGSPLEDCEAPGWQKMQASNAPLCSPDATGVARTRLLPGRYRVRMVHLGQRPSLGQLWPPDGEDTIEVTSTSTRRRLVFPRPRRVDLELQPSPGSHAPSHWTVSDGVHRRDARGNYATLWLTEDSTSLQVHTEPRGLIGTAAVPVGAEPTTLFVSLRD